MTTTRRLAAILAADVAGYSRLMAADEVGTLAALKACRHEVVDPTIAAHRGRIVKTTGDGMLVEFASAVDAVTCAVAVQEAMAARGGALSFRIGINVGDIIIDGDDIFGDGVNVAARVENECQPGQVSLSGNVFEQIRNKTTFEFDDLGEQSLKNIDWPVRIYSVRVAGTSAASISFPDTPRPLTLPDKPSIAVLPFENMTGDPEQEYFADGIAEDVLTTLSKIQELFVIARTSSFVFKRQSRDIREIGQMLGARYVLEGSVRKAGSRVRLTAQLVDSLNGGHVWADRFEGDVDAVFDLQDRITQDIVAALEVKLTFGEEVRVWRKRSGSPLVYDCFLKGRALYVNFAKHTHAEARSEFERALAINPRYTPALCMLGFALTDQARFGWEKDATTAYEAALECAARALAVDPDSDEAYINLGYTRLFQRRHDDAVAAGKKAVALSPNGGNYHIAGMIHGYAGDFRTAAQYEEQSQRLSPLSRNESWVDEARARFHLGQLDAARDIASRVLIERPHWLSGQTTLAAALWNLGREEEARVIVRKMLASHPHLTANRWAQGMPYRQKKDLDALVAPLRLAGLPE